jgi:hypothetical protein
MRSSAFGSGRRASLISRLNSTCGSRRGKDELERLAISSILGRDQWCRRERRSLLPRSGNLQRNVRTRMGEGGAIGAVWIRYSGPANSQRWVAGSPSGNNRNPYQDNRNFARSERPRNPAGRARQNHSKPKLRTL